MMDVTVHVMREPYAARPWTTIIAKLPNEGLVYLSKVSIQDVI
jgi:hypothetical protein